MLTAIKKGLGRHGRVSAWRMIADIPHAAV